jgi:hypothetical protein
MEGERDPVRLQDEALKALLPATASARRADRAGRIFEPLDSKLAGRFVLIAESIWGRGMLQNLSQQVQECCQHAEECRRKAAAQVDPDYARTNWNVAG